MIVVAAVSTTLATFTTLDSAVAFTFVAFMTLATGSAAILSFNLFEFFTGSWFC
jgi:hypothetical protein